MANEKIKSLLKSHSISQNELCDALWNNTNRLYKTPCNNYIASLLEKPLSQNMESKIYDAINFISNTRKIPINSFKDQNGDITIFSIRFHITRRTYNAIKRSGIKTTNELFNMTEKDFRRMRNIGNAVVVEVKKLGDVIGKSFQTNDDDIYQKVFRRLNFKPNTVVELDELVKTIIRYTREEIER